MESIMDMIKTDDKVNLKDLIERFNMLVASHNELVEEVESLKASKASQPKSERQMTEDDARRILLGDMKDFSHKKAAEELNLSYGQIYSARKGFTFKTIYQEWNKAQKAA